jgi:copper(I)-binding protein
MMQRIGITRAFARVMLALVALSASVPTQAHEYYADGFTVVHPWGEASDPTSRDAPIFMTIESISQNDRLLSAHTRLADRVEFRAGPDASAPPLASIAITAGPDMAFKASGYHLLLKGLKAPLEWGRNYSMGLKFERAGVINVLVSVGAH